MCLSFIYYFGMSANSCNFKNKITEILCGMVKSTTKIQILNLVRFSFLASVLELSFMQESCAQLHPKKAIYFPTGEKNNGGFCH
jgi:hypothetical protein